MAADRESLGLGALKPSEMIAGLDEVAKRAEKMEAREEARRRAGGKISANVAVLTDDTGRRWTRNVNIFIGVTVAALVIGGGTLMYFANYSPLDVREGNAEARKMLTELAARAPRLNPNGLTAAKAREQYQRQLEAEYKNVLEAIEREREMRIKTGRKLGPDTILTKERDWLDKVRKLQDAWGQPFVFEMEGEMLRITAKGKKTAASSPPEPVTVRPGVVKGLPEKSAP